MNVIVMVTAVLLAIAVGPATAQDRERGGGLGGVLDTLGGLLGGGNKAHGTVVLARDTSVVFRTDDARTWRVDTASLDADVRRQLRRGQSATLTVRGAGGDVVTATDVQIDQTSNGRTFSTVSGTVQERSEDRLTFRTREGLTLPVETSRLRGLPAFKPNDPATLIYEQGPRQEIVAVWLEPGDVTGGTSTSSPSTSPSDVAPSASLPSRQTVEGTVETLGRSRLTLQTSDGRRVEVDASGLDSGALDAVRPGDRVTVTGTSDTSTDQFIANSVTRR
jgi:hypothetical protein